MSSFVYGKYHPRTISFTITTNAAKVFNIKKKAFIFSKFPSALSGSVKSSFVLYCFSYCIGLQSHVVINIYIISVIFNIFIPNSYKSL